MVYDNFTEIFKNCLPPNCTINDTIVNWSSGVRPIYITYITDYTFQNIVWLIFNSVFLTVNMYILLYGGRGLDPVRSVWRHYFKRKNNKSVLSGTPGSNE